MIFILLLLFPGQNQITDNKLIVIQEHWSIELPDNYRDSSWTGLDTRFGKFFADSGGFMIQFEWSGFEGKWIGYGKELVKVKCDLKSEYERNVAYFNSPYFNEKYNDSLWQLTIDTIDSRIALFISPINRNVGRSECLIRECENTGFIELNARLPSLEDQKKFRAYCKSIRFLK